MSTTQKTTQTNAFDPQALATYHGFLGGLGPLIRSWMDPNIANTDPFRIQLGANMGAANTLGQDFYRNLTQNMRASSGGAMNVSPFQQAMLAYGGRNQSELRSQAFQNAYLSGIGRQLFGAQLASGFRPLQTGGTQTQTMSGLGTWLPQAIMGGLSIAGSIPTGGLGAINQGWGSNTLNPSNQIGGGFAPGFNPNLGLTGGLGGGTPGPSLSGPPGSGW